MDLLKKMFLVQQEFDQWVEEERNIQMSFDEWVVHKTVCMASELEEVRNEVNWKPWKNPKQVNEDKLKEEVIDLWKFLISLSSKIGMDSEEVYDLFIKKDLENWNRQKGKSSKEGYTIHG